MIARLLAMKPLFGGAKAERARSRGVRFQEFTRICRRESRLNFLHFGRRFAASEQYQHATPLGFPEFHSVLK